MKLLPGVAEEVGMSTVKLGQLTRHAEQWIAKGDLLGLVVLVARRGRVVLHRAFGRLGPATDDPLPIDALFRLASLTKPITATAALILAEDGLLGLARPVVEYVPEFVGPDKDLVLVADLLTHTAGLRDEDVISHLRRKRAERRSTADWDDLPPALVANAPWAACLWDTYDVSLRTPPDVEMAYCSYGYDLLGEIIARASGQPLAGFAGERIFSPLGMNDTFYVYPASQAHRIAQPPPAGPRSAFLTAIDAIRHPFGSGTAYATAADLAIFAQTFLNGGVYGETRILSPATVATMTRNQIPGIRAHWKGQDFREAGWGYGWSIEGAKRSRYYGALWSPQTYGHSGLGSTFLWIDPVYELVGICLSTVCHPGLHGQSDWRADLIANLVMGAIVDL